MKNTQKKKKLIFRNKMQYSRFHNLKKKKQHQYKYRRLMSEWIRREADKINEVYYVKRLKRFYELLHVKF